MTKMSDIGIASIIDPMVSAAMNYVPVFVPTGWTFLQLAITLSLGFAVYDWWLDSPSGALARLIRSGLMTLIVVTLLNGWAGHMKTFTNFFSVELAAPLTKGAKTSSEALSKMIDKISTSMFPDARKEKTVSEKIWEFIKERKSIGEYLFMNLTRALFELILFVLSAIIITALVFAFYGPILVLQVGAIFGPLLLPWVIFGPLEGLAKAWFKFMISTGFTLLVTLCLGLVAAEAVTVFTDAMSSYGKNPNVTWVEEMVARIGGLVAIASGMIFISLMILKADDIAAAMTGGGGGGSGVAGAAVRTVTSVANKISKIPGSKK
jgi:hypothetical protein